MKVIKPLKLGVLHRTFEYKGRCFWSPAVMAFFSFGQKPHLLTEIDMWTFAAEELGKEGIIDQGMPKERGELLVTGAFHSPSGKPVPAGQVRAQLGPLDKTLYIYGDRYWKRGANLVWNITDPEPMTMMPVCYDKSFGGPGYKYNPLGKGVTTAADSDLSYLQPLPNVEDPGQLVGSRRDKPKPAGFGPLDVTWPQRYKKCGTYDTKWYNTRFPGLADDIDWTFFNTAPDDQQIQGFFHGNEPFAVEWMHPEKPILESRLPAVRPRCFITHNKNEDSSFLEVDLNLDTVWLFPHAEKGILIYHGLTEVLTDTAKDIEHLLIAYEFQKDKPRNLIHYHEALTRRLDKEKGGLALLNESDLIANGERSGFAEMMAGEGAAAMKSEGLLQKKQKIRVEKDIHAVRDMIAQQGLDPDTTLPLPATAMTGGDAEDLDFDQILIDAEEQRQKADQTLAEQLKALGMTKEDLLAKAAAEPAPRPVFSARQAIAAYKEIGINDPDLEAKMIGVEENFAKTYCQAGYALPPVIAPSVQEAEQKKTMLLEAYAAGKSLQGADLAGVDLSGLELEGIDLRGALLEDANLSHANLTKADLEGAALLRTDLSQADLSSANLAGAGLGRANLCGARLVEAKLSGASLVRADLTDAVLTDADLQEADLSETKACRADFSGANLKKGRFIEADLSHARFVKADLSEGLFYKTQFTESDFSGAVLSSSVLVEVAADRCLFRQANLQNIRAAFKCSLSAVDFQDANLCQCNFRGADLTASRFIGAQLSNSDFSEAKLNKCDFSHAVAKQSLFIEADLTGAKMVATDLFESLLQKAILYETDLKGANLYAVDFMKAKFRNTDVRLALLHKSTLGRWVPK